MPTSAAYCISLLGAGPMKRNLGPFYSHWCALLDFHLKRKRLTGQAFARLVRKSQQVIHGYQTGKSRPPLDVVRSWAAALGLSPHEREQFVTAAYEAWTPAPIWAKLLELEQRAYGAAGKVTEPGEVGILRAAVDEMAAVLREVETLFYTRSVPGGVDEIRRKRTEVGLAIRKLLEANTKAPSRKTPPPPQQSQ